VKKLWLLLLAACAHPAFTPDDDRAVRAVLAAQRDAWNRGDLDGYMAGYARDPQLVFTSGGKIRRGWQQALDAYRARYGDARATMGTLAFEILEVRAVGADAAIVLGRWSLVDTPSAGAGVFSLVLARTRDGWRVIHDHTSADAK
jgi:uncharacterized protein (TIGR02246 family)